MKIFTQIGDVLADYAMLEGKAYPIALLLVVGVGAGYALCAGVASYEKKKAAVRLGFAASDREKATLAAALIPDQKAIQAYSNAITGTFYSGVAVPVSGEVVTNTLFLNLTPDQTAHIYNVQRSVMLGYRYGYMMRSYGSKYEDGEQFIEGVIQSAATKLAENK